MLKLDSASELLEQQRARLLAIVDMELQRIYNSVLLAPMDAEQRRTLETVARLLKELEKRDGTNESPAKLSAEEIGKALSGNPG